MVRSIAFFVARRLVLLVVTLFAVSALVFVVTRILPGDVATMILGQYATPEDLATLRRRLGLDQPALVQFLHWLAAMLGGDFGLSTRFQLPVSEVMREPLRNSALLAAAGIAFAVPVGLAFGTFCAIRRGSAWDHIVSGATVFAAAMPEFVTGGILIVVFSTWLGWLPPFAGGNGSDSIGRSISELVLPVLSLSLVILGYILRMMRTSAGEVLDSEFVKAAVLKGLDKRRILLFHVLPIALGPTLAVIALSIGWMAGGLVVVESLFGFPGIGRLLVFAIQNRDVPLLQTITLVVAAVYALANLCADVAQRLLDPRVIAR
jgi:peptide/nickel transport system permease protein